MALSLANLAALRRARGQAGAAEELLRRALGIREDALGPDHPLVRRTSSLKSFEFIERVPKCWCATRWVLRRLGMALGPDDPLVRPQQYLLEHLSNAGHISCIQDLEVAHGSPAC